MTRLEIFSRNIFSALKKAKSTHFIYMKLRIIQNISGELWRGMWELNPRGLSTTDLTGLPHTRLWLNGVITIILPLQYGVKMKYLYGL